jgi:hypothetical protein
MDRSKWLKTIVAPWRRGAQYFSWLRCVLLILVAFDSPPPSSRLRSPPFRNLDPEESPYMPRLRSIVGAHRVGRQPPASETVARPSTWLGTVSLSNREARNMRERRDVDRLGSHLVWPVSLVPPVSRGYPGGVFSCCAARVTQQENIPAGCSKRPSSKAAASEGPRRTLWGTLRV